MPMTVMSVWGSVRHMRPLPSLSSTQIVPVSATAKLAPLMATWAEKNCSAKIGASCRGQLLGIVGEVLPLSSLGDGTAKEVADLAAILVNGWHEDV